MLGPALTFNTKGVSDYVGSTPKAFLRTSQVVNAIIFYRQQSICLHSVFALVFNTN